MTTVRRPYLRLKRSLSLRQQYISHYQPNFLYFRPVRENVHTKTNIYVAGIIFYQSLLKATRRRLETEPGLIDNREGAYTLSYMHMEICQPIRSPDNTVYVRCASLVPRETVSRKSTPARVCDMSRVIRYIAMQTILNVKRKSAEGLD